MTSDSDFFDLGPTLDVFPSEVDAVVISVYKATIEGIELLDERERAELKSRGVIQQEIMWWEDQVQALKYHAGNMGLVSLVLLLDSWVSKRQQGKNLIDRFRQLASTIAPTPLTEKGLEEMVTARNSIIHHRGKAEYKDTRGNLHTVNDRFLDFGNPLGEGRVAVEQSLLTELASKMTDFVNLWNRIAR